MANIVVARRPGPAYYAVDASGVYVGEMRGYIEIERVPDPDNAITKKTMQPLMVEKTVWGDPDPETGVARKQVQTVAAMETPEPIYDDSGQHIVGFRRIPKMAEVEEVIEPAFKEVDGKEVLPQAPDGQTLLPAGTPAPPSADAVWDGRAWARPK